MTERPILFGAPMVRAILDGTKTQTRRVVKPRQLPSVSDESREWGLKTSPSLAAAYCPYGQEFGRLWVRETWCVVHGIPQAGGVPHPDDFVRYRADDGPGEKVITDVKGWHPSIHMPRVYSRITLEIVSVRVERLNEITRGDCMAEGCPFQNIADGEDPRQWFSDLWQSINGPGSWVTNPWVWVVEFKKLP